MRLSLFSPAPRGCLRGHSSHLLTLYAAFSLLRIALTSLFVPLSLVIGASRCKVYRRASWAVMSSLQYLLHREPLLAPLVEPAIHPHDMGIAHLLQRLNREQLATAG